MKTMQILGVRVDDVSLVEILNKIEEYISSQRHAIIAHLNIRGVNIALEQKWLEDFYKNADLVYCDGMGVTLGARLLGYPALQRHTLADWVWSLAEFADEHGYTIFLLGNPKGVVERAAKKLITRFGGLKIVGEQHGFFNKDNTSLENQSVIKLIKDKQPNILLVGFGMPIQEKWVMENLNDIPANVTIMVGALFEYIAMDLKRGPKWMTNYYLEWLWRVINSPKRYLKRYASDIPKFLFRIIKFKLTQGRTEQAKSG